jgi:nicotinamide phosphoribosyltransferase
MDSYDYTYALDKIVPALIPYKEEKGKNSLWVLRPDSGNPVDVIIQALEAGDKAVGHTVKTVNGNEFRVLNGVNAIQVLFFFLYPALSSFFVMLILL